MIKIIKKIVFEPLLQFLLLGFILYLYYDYITPDVQLGNKKVINVSSYELQQIKFNYKKEWQKEINEEQLKALIAKKYYEKILLNEAYSLGLEKQDKEISKRLLKQMHFLMLNSSEILEPTEEELHKYYLKNIGDYSNIKTISFSHIYFSNPEDKKIKSTFKLLTIAKIDANHAASFSEDCSEKNDIKNLTYNEVKAIFGHYFASKIFKLKKGLWHNRIRSKNGVHLVYITKKVIGDAYIFDEVQDRVYLDYLNEYRRNKENEAYKRISSQYSLKVE